MKVSVMLVTWNRSELVKDTLIKNMASAGREFDELIWVDNGSSDGMVEVARGFKPNALVCHRENLGVSVGYNRAFALCTGDWIMNITDRNIGPEGWLKMLCDIAATDQVDTISMWSSPWEPPKERHLPGAIQDFSGHRCAPAIAFETTLFRRSLLTTAGYWREDLGMYGWNDVEWADRLRVRNARTFVMCDQMVTRAQDVAVQMNGEDYRAWRDKEINSPAKHQRLAEIRSQGFPYYNPFS